MNMFFLNSPHAGESTRFLGATVGGEAAQLSPHGCAERTSRSPEKGEELKEERIAQ